MKVFDYDYCFEKVIGHEGGFTDRSSDPGNWSGGRVGKGVLKGTKYGISAASYPHLDIRNLTLDDAKRIYYDDYYRASGASMLVAGLNYAVFDAAVNCGNARARKWLQAAVGVAQDGIIGPQTRKALAIRMADDPLGVLREFQSQRTRHHMGLTSMVKEYGLGWSRRIIDVTMSATKIIIGNM